MVRKSRTTFEDPAERVAFLEKSEGSQSPPLSSLPRFGPPSTSTISISPALGSGPLGTDAGKSAPRAWRRLVGASLFGITVFGAGLYASRDFGRSWQAVQEAADKLDFLQSLRPTQAVDLGAAVVDDDDALIAGLSSVVTKTTLARPTRPVRPTVGSKPSALPLPDQFLFPSRPTTAFEPLASYSSDSTFLENVRPRPHPVPAPVDPSERFLAYSPHSGFHNQRKEVENAFTLAKLLNRTLILPPARLGRPVPWAWTDRLQRLWNDEIKSGNRDCLAYKGIGPDGILTSTPPDRCTGYADWTSVQWDYLFNIAPITKSVPVVDRWDYRQEWLWEAFDLKQGELVVLQDPDRYSYQILEKSGPSGPGKASNPKYKLGITLDTLRAYDHVKVLEMGSVYGSGRLDLKSSAAKSIRVAVRKAQICRHPVIGEVSDAIAERLGGRGQYVGMHLRVGDGVFRSQASVNMPRVFQRVASALFGLDQATIDALVARSAAMQAPRRAHPRRHLAARTPTEPVARSLWGDEEADGEDDVLVASPPEGSRLRKRQSTDTSGSRRIASSVRCRGKLHTDPTLAVLNTPVYIATDSRKPMSDPNLKLFFDTFPCSFVLSDFVKVTDVNRVPVAAFEKLAGLTSAEDGLKLDKFLYPLLEAVIAAKASGLVGTPVSTFSEYAVTFLHPAYAAEIAVHNRGALA